MNSAANNFGFHYKKLHLLDLFGFVFCSVFLSLFLFLFFYVFFCLRFFIGEHWPNWGPWGPHGPHGAHGPHGPHGAHGGPMGPNWANVPQFGKTFLKKSVKQKQKTKKSQNISFGDENQSCSHRNSVQFCLKNKFRGQL